MEFTISLAELAEFENKTDNWLQARLAFALQLMTPEGEFGTIHRSGSLYSPRDPGHLYRHTEKEIAVWEKTHPRPQLIPGRGPFPSVDPITLLSTPTTPTPP